MAKPKYHLTPTAVENLRDIGRKTAEEWGNPQARKYLEQLRHGFERIARDHRTFVNRDDMNGGTGLSLYHVEKHYVAFTQVADNEVVIAAVIHHSRDVPNYLKEIGFEIRRILQEIKEQRPHNQPAKPVPTTRIRK